MQIPRTIAVALLLCVCACSAPQAGEDESRERSFESVDVEGEPMYTVLPPDGIPAIDDPELVSAAEADAFLAPDEPVLGVVGANGAAKAYSAWQLDRHEIVNDWIDGEPIAATWWPLANAGVVYSRRVEASVRSFGVSGKLWHGVLVMYDRESDSLWTQLDGRAIQGEKIGSKLEHVPSVFTTWAEWKAAHPDTQALRKSEEDREQTGSRYAEYFADPDRLFMPHLAEGLGGGVGPKQTVFGMVVNGQACVVTEDLLVRDRVVNTVVAGVPVAWVLDERTGAPLGFDRRLAQRVVVLATHGQDNPAKVVVDSLTGASLATGELTAVRVDRAFWYAWSRSHPGSRVLAD